MDFKTADSNDFDQAFYFIENLWTYNDYDREQVRTVYEQVIHDPASFAFFLVENGEYKGFCHGDYFQTFWMSGLTCYVSSLITHEKERGKGYGRCLLDHARELAVKRGCKAVILDSGMPRTSAHAFYENYGFEKSCYGFELLL